MIWDKLKEENIVLNFRETEYEKRHFVTGQYPHILKIDDKNLILYYQIHNPDKICGVAYAISNDGGLTFKKSKNNYVLKNSLACHNFRTFTDTNPNSKTKFKAIGGFHTGQDGCGHKNCSCNDKGIKQKDCYDPVWPNIGRKCFYDDVNHPCHGNGYYVWESDNGINWRTMFDKPVLSNFTMIKEYDKEGYVGSDGYPTIFYDDNINEYVLYLRSNVKLGVRHVVYTKSKDLIKWDIPELIKLNPEFNFNHDNLYYVGVYKHPEIKNRYISFTPYFKNIIHDSKGEHRTYHNEGLLIMYSEDRKNWVIKDKIFKSSENPEYSGHFKMPQVVGFITSPDQKEYWLYVHKGHLTNNSRLVRFSIKKDKFNETLC